jgi:hypothetical protein
MDIECPLTVNVESAEGYPYLVQLVGFHVWEAMGRAGKLPWLPLTPV